MNNLDILAQMKANSDAWHSADAKTRVILHDANLKLGALIGAGSFNEGTGKYSNIAYDNANKMVLPTLDQMVAGVTTPTPTAPLIPPVVTNNTQTGLGTQTTADIFPNVMNGADTEKIITLGVALFILSTLASMFRRS